MGGHDLEFQQLKLINSMMHRSLGKMLLFIWEFQQVCLKEGEMNLTSDKSGSRSTYTTISDERLYSDLRDVLEILPDAGETYIIGACCQLHISTP